MPENICWLNDWARSLSNATADNGMSGDWARYSLIRGVIRLGRIYAKTVDKINIIRPLKNRTNPGHRKALVRLGR